MGFKNNLAMRCRVRVLPRRDLTSSVMMRPGNLLGIQKTLRCLISRRQDLPNLTPTWLETLRDDGTREDATRHTLPQQENCGV